MSTQRIRDPLHDLIEFSNGELERTLWSVVQTRPFQRLRRVKQLGFSETVYPGATHSRFAHSLGVFHTARRLMTIVRRHTEENITKENHALAAALVHDLGHGPFSHAFEKVGKRLNLKLADHEQMSDRLIREGEVAEVLNRMGSGFASDVADIIKKDGRKTVHNAVVSSQFDADRLDYMRRDRMMTGVRHAAIDFEWLMANLEVGSVSVGVDEASLGKVDTFVLGAKATQAAEAYVLGLFQLYPTVYFHKATRGAEKLFTELLVRVVTLARDSMSNRSGLPNSHPINRFALAPEDVDVALCLDDSVVAGAFSLMADASDPLVSQFARRLRDRKFFKCIDIRLRVAHILDADSQNTEDRIERIDRCCASINQKLTARIEDSVVGVPRILIDSDERSPYKASGESGGPLGRINIQTGGGGLVDLKQRSSVVGALKSFKLLRAYVDADDSASRRDIEDLVNDEVQHVSF